MRINIKSSFWIISTILIASSAISFASDSHADTNSATKVTPGTFSGAKPTEYPSWFKESFLEFSDDIAEAAEQGKRVMLLMHQDGCPYCNILVERNLSQKNIVDLMRSKFEVIELNIWGDREVITVDGETFTEKEFAAALRVQFTPTLLFFNEQGKPILTLNGYLPPNEFLTALRFVAENHESRMSYREFVRSQPASNEGANELIEEVFFQSPPYNLVRSGGTSDKPLAVFFEQKQCPNCETLHHKVLVDEDTRNLLTNFDVVQLDMWSDQPLISTTGATTTAREWASELDVSYAPTILLFNSVGEEVIRSEAWFKIFHTQSLFDYVHSESYQFEPNFQRYISARADHFIEQGIDVDIWR